MYLLCRIRDSNTNIWIDGNIPSIFRHPAQHSRDVAKSTKLELYGFGCMKPGATTKAQAGRAKMMHKEVNKHLEEWKGQIQMGAYHEAPICGSCGWTPS